MNYLSIAIDGPSGSGKSTLAKMLANSLGFIYLDTGAIYRAVALYVSRAGFDPGDEAETTALLDQCEEIHFGHVGNEQKVFFNDEDVSEEIRSPEVSIWASFVAAYPAVRAFLLERQREFARRCNVVMDGRDIGTVVLPDASLKIFLNATAERRAERRHLELKKRGVKVSFEEVLQDIVERDERDMSREISPLRQAADAFLVDSTELDLAQTHEMMLQLAKTHLGVLPV